jgi:hypothetical protein
MTLGNTKRTAEQRVRDAKRQAYTDVVKMGRATLYENPEAKLKDFVDAIEKLSNLRRIED